MWPIGTAPGVIALPWPGLFLTLGFALRDRVVVGASLAHLPTVRVLSATV